MHSAESAPAHNPKALPTLYTEAMRVNGALMGEILLHLPHAKHDHIATLLRGGAILSVETLIDRRTAFTVRLVAIKPKGGRVVLSEVSSPCETLLGEAN